MNHPTPAIDRRRFLRLAGGGTVAAALPLAGCSSAYPDAAVAAWQADVAAEPDPRRHALAMALLAPNPHNRQPWIADLQRPGEITLFCDTGRLLPETDPFGRQILIGHGAFLELLSIAAAERGQRAAIELFPAGEFDARTIDRRPVARIVMQPAPGLPRDPLYAMIRRRHTHKGRYDATRPLPPEAAAVLQATLARHGTLFGGAIAEAAGRARVTALAREAYVAEIGTPRTYLESARLFRIGPDEIERHRDGISINTPMPRLLSALGLFDRLQPPAPDSAAMKQAMARWADFETGSGYLWIASRDAGRRAQIEAGRAYVRLHLALTAAGLDLHPLSQALQEFPEVAGPYRALHAQLGLDPARTPLQMLARVGFGVGNAPATPRRGLQALLQPA